METRMTNDLLIDNKKTELKVKLSLLKHNTIEMKRELDKGFENQRELNAKYVASREIDELRNFQRNNLNEKIISTNIKTDNLKKDVNHLLLERNNLERENNYLSQKKNEVGKEKSNLLSLQDELLNKRQILENEVQLLRDKFNKNEKVKMDNEIINSTSNKQFDYLNNKLSENNRKIHLLQNKIDDLILDIKDCKEILTNENYESNNLNDFNHILETRIITLRESVKLNENKNFHIKKEIENILVFKDEIESERINLDIKLDKLIKNLTILNSANNKINTFIGFIIESLSIKNKYLNNENIKLERTTEMKNKIVKMLKEINSYKELVENF